MTSSIPHKIAIQTLKTNEKNIVCIGGTSLLVFYDGSSSRVVHDLCPHMGGPLTQGRYCSKTGVFTCPWHGYKYSTSSLSLIENPNEAIWVKPLAAGKEAQFKTPEYKLRSIKHHIDNGYLILDEDL